MTTQPADEIRTEGRFGRRDPKRAAMSGWIGSALEYYDFALYSQAAALVFPAIFFPSENPTVAIIASLATYAVGYVSRPLGAVVLGAWGDRHGRKNVLVFAMLLMGCSTFAVGLLPTYGQVGLLAPALLVTLRLIQGFAVAGELGGASAMIVEHSPDARRGFFASFSLQGTQFGSILATGAMLPLAAVLSEDQFQTWGWRIPFLLSAFVILAGYIIRRRVQEPPAYLAKSGEIKARHRFPLVELLRTRPWVLVRCVLMTFTNVIGMATLVFGVAYATQEGYGVGWSASDLLWVTLVANVTAVVTIPLFGALSDRIGRRPVYAIGAAGAAVWAFAFFPLLDTENRAVIVLATVVALVTHAAMYGPQAAFIVELFSTRLRYSGASMGYQIAGIFGGALAPIISIKLVQVTGTAFAVSAYVLLALLITLVALWFAPETSRVDLHAEHPDAAKAPATRTGRLADEGHH
jgi:MFS family permease